MVFKGKFPIRCKVVVEDEVLEQVSHFDFLGCDIGCEHDDKNKSVKKYQMMCGKMQRTLRNKTRNDTKMKFYKLMAIPVLTGNTYSNTYACETWTITEKEKQHIHCLLYTSTFSILSKLLV